MGMNFQNCHRMVFCGMSDSWESYYQAVRRCWRFGQESPVEAYVVVSGTRATDRGQRAPQRKPKSPDGSTDSSGT